MTWLAFKTLLKKAGVWCRSNWQLLLGVGLGVAVLLIFRKGVPDFSRLYRDIVDRRQEELDKVEEAYQEQIRLQEEATQRAFEAMRQVEADYRSRSEELDNRRRKQVQKELDSVKDDPVALARKLAELTGATYVPREDR